MSTLLHDDMRKKKEHQHTRGMKRRTCTDSVEGSVSTTFYLFERLQIQSLLPKGKIRKNGDCRFERDKSHFKSGNSSKYHEGDGEKKGKVIVRETTREISLFSHP